MAKYTLIESRDAFENHDVAQTFALVAALAETSEQVTLFLVHNGVLLTRKSRLSQLIADAAAHKVEVLADEFSLRERGIDVRQLAPGVKAAPLDTVVDHMVEGRKVWWN